MAAMREASIQTQRSFEAMGLLGCRRLVFILPCVLFDLEIAQMQSVLITC